MSDIKAPALPPKASSDASLKAVSAATARKKPTKLNAWGNALGGALSGVAAVVASYPFDLLKTRAQFEVGKGGADKKKVSLVSVGQKIWAEGYAVGGVPRGVLGFYRGLDQLVPEAAFKTMLRFFTFKELNDVYMSLMNIKKMDTLGNVICGAAAGALETALVVQPFERGKTLKADFQVPSKVYGELYKKSGSFAVFRSMYTGFMPTLGRQVGNQATSFAAFYGMKDLYIATTGEKDLNNMGRIVAGFGSGAFACCVTMPMDVAKTIAQKNTDLSNKQGTVAIMRKVYADRGIAGLYAGLTPRVGRVGLDRATGFLAFEWLQEQMLKFKSFTD
jgi:hypothetical protein